MAQPYTHDYYCCSLCNRLRSPWNAIRGDGGQFRPQKRYHPARAVGRNFRALSIDDPYLASEIYLRPKKEKKIFWVVDKDRRTIKTYQEDKNFDISTFNDQCRRLLHVNEHVAAAVHLFPIREDTHLALRALDPYDYISLHPKILPGVA